MEFTGENELPVPPEEAWVYFTDPEVLRDCAPGLKEMNMVSPSEIDAVISVKLGSVSPEFDVDVVVTEAEEPSMLALKATGSASRGSFEANAEMHLREDGDGTVSEWTATAEMSGLIASLGQRALGPVTKRLVNQFYDCMEEKITEGAGATSQLEAAEDADL